MSALPVVATHSTPRRMAGPHSITHRKGPRHSLELQALKKVARYITAAKSTVTPMIVSAA